MGKLIYSMITSVDGYVSDPDGNFGWGAPEEESHEFVNALSRSIGTYLYGRRMYETMVYWETAHQMPDPPPFVLEYARIWQATDKVVYSTTLDEVASERTRIERSSTPTPCGS
jgi:dihydrofolate reductase